MASRLSRPFIILMFVVGLTLSTIGPAAAGFPPGTGADTGGGNGGGGSGGGSGGPGGGTPGGGGGTGGGGGGSVGGGYWSATYIVKGKNASKTAVAPTPRSPNSRPITQRCTGQSQFGPYVGGRFIAAGATTSSTENGEAGNGSYRLYYLASLSKECFPPSPYRDETLECGWTVSGTGVGATGNPRATATTKNFPVASTRFKSTGAKNIAECGRSMTQNFAWSKGDLGRYELRATGKAVFCQVRRYLSADFFGNKPADKILSCGNLHNYSNSRVRWELFCNGGALGWSNRSYSEEACGDGSNAQQPYKWTCGIPSNGQPYLSGVRNNASVDVFHDAKKRDLTWRYQPNLKGGVKNPTNKKVKLVYKSGTPFRTGLSQSDSTQHFLSVPKMNAYAKGWAGSSKNGRTTFDMQFFKEGLPGKNLKMAPTWYFEAQFLTRSMTSITVNFKTGGVTVNTKNSYTKQTATCTGPATNLAVQRARISN